MHVLYIRDLPHSIHYETREVCLFVKDLDKTDREYEKTVQHYQDLLRQNGITCISKVEFITKISKLGHQKNCSNLIYMYKNLEVRFYYRLTCLKDSGRMTNRVDADQTARSAV